MEYLILSALTFNTLAYRTYPQGWTWNYQLPYERRAYPPYGQIVSQIIPPGKPWPANAEDYVSFSQTSRLPNVTPIWARKTTTTTTSTTTTTPPVIHHRDDLPSINTHWARPIIVFHQPRNRTEVTSTTMRKQSDITPTITTNIVDLLSTTRGTTPSTIASTIASTIPSTIPSTTVTTSATTEITQQSEALSLDSFLTGLELLNLQNESNLELFTSSPPKALKELTINDEPKVGNISVANLLPDQSQTPKEPKNMDQLVPLPLNN